MNPLLLISPQGRIARGEFWLGFALVMMLNLFAGATPVVGPAIAVLLLWPQTVLQIKRLHDMGWSGWLLLLPFSVTLVCTALIVTNNGMALLISPMREVMALAAKPEMHKPLVYLEIAGAVEIAFLLWVGSTKGDTAANRFGPVPGARGS